MQHLQVQFGVSTEKHVPLPLPLLHPTPQPTPSPQPLNQSESRNMFATPSRVRGMMARVNVAEFSLHAKHNVCIMPG